MCQINLRTMTIASSNKLWWEPVLAGCLPMYILIVVFLSFLLSRCIILSVTSSFSLSASLIFSVVLLHVSCILCDVNTTGTLDKNLNDRQAKAARCFGAVKWPRQWDYHYFCSGSGSQWRKEIFIHGLWNCIQKRCSQWMGEQHFPVFNAW